MSLDLERAVENNNISLAVETGTESKDSFCPEWYLRNHSAVMML